mmetsp:Transcript_47104/g.143119  ORF Transcript_47104/g.143119 Transcript_47104/m.143119 type:complete len:217 (+) Transcript_47104:528-1178(+)
MASHVLAQDAWKQCPHAVRTACSAPARLSRQIGHASQLPAKSSAGTLSKWTLEGEANRTVASACASSCANLMCAATISIHSPRGTSEGETSKMKRLAVPLKRVPPHCHTWPSSGRSWNCAPLPGTSQTSQGVIDKSILPLRAMRATWPLSESSGTYQLKEPFSTATWRLRQLRNCNETFAHCFRTLPASLLGRSTLMVERAVGACGVDPAGGVAMR